MATETSKKTENAPRLEEPKLMLALENGVISAKEFSYVSGGLMGCTALVTDGSSRLFVEKEDPTELEFYGLDEAILSLALDEKKQLVLEASGLDERDELPWLEYDSKGDPIEGQNESDLLDVWLAKTIDEDDYENWGSRTASQYAPGFELLDVLNARDRNDLGLHEGDLGGPASSVPCVAMTASIEQFNRLMKERGLPYVIVDDGGQ